MASLGRTRSAFAVLLAASLVTVAVLPSLAATVPAEGRGTSTIDGLVADAVTGLPLPGAAVGVIGQAATTTDRAGTFRLPGLAAGSYRVHVERDGYQPAESSPIAVEPGATARVTLGVQRAPSGSAQALRTLGATSTRATETLQRASTIYRTVSPEALLQVGSYRAGDALRSLPGINNAIGGDTASLSDDLQLQIRGLGTNETTALLDGHPIAFGVPGGYNYQLTPAFSLRNINVIYGSGGTELSGYDAIGGIVDQQTIEPSRVPRGTFTQGYGSFDRAETAATATGTLGRLGYAFAYGVGSLNGPFHDDTFYQPGAAYDPSATDPAVRALGVYKDSGMAVQRSALQKLRYELSPATRLTFTALQSNEWEDKTGNGDGDYLTPTVALAQGEAKLAGKGASDPCPAGTFAAVTGANDAGWGTGPTGAPDGGSPCQTPHSYASAIAGFQGAGPAWQSFDLNDQDVRFDATGQRADTRLDLFTDRYRTINDRAFALPFVKVPGDNGFFDNTDVATTGVSGYENFHGAANAFALGFEYLNDAYGLRHDGSLVGAPITREYAEFLRDAYHAPSSPLAAYTSVYVKHSTVTNTSYADPRLSLVFALPNGRDVARVAAGATTTQPTADLVDQQFTPGSLFAAGGGGGIQCGGITSVGSAPSSLLRPERGVDEEFAYGRRFASDSQVQLELYTTNVYGKIYQAVTPLATTGTAFIAPAELAAAENLLRSTCGAAANPLAALGVSGAVNLGTLRARGFTVSGRQRLTRAVYVDYDYATTSTTLRSAPVDYLKNDLTAVVGAQVPYLPLHTLTAAVDVLATPTFDLRYTLHALSDNNNKHSGGYNSSDLRGSVTTKYGTFTAFVSNVFDQDADIRGLLGEGVPLALNRYATAANAAPYSGANATERFGLPYRSFFASYSLHVR